MQEGLLTGLSPEGRVCVLSGPIFSRPVNRAQSGSERHAIVIMRFKIHAHCAWFAVPFAKLLEAGSNYQRTSLPWVFLLRALSALEMPQLRNIGFEAQLEDKSFDQAAALAFIERSHTSSIWC